MLTSIFFKLTDYALFRRLIWKNVYEMLAKKFTVKDWSFMNYGYAPSAAEVPVLLQEHDEINRYPIQLYHYLATKVKIQGANILEVGSGRGGGADYIARYLQPSTVVGMDIARNAVRLSEQNYKGGMTRFVAGSAEKLPFADGEFDIVINVESSHAYGSVSRFLSEVKRVLRPGGYLLMADLRTNAGASILRQELEACGMQVDSAEDISLNVARGIELEEPVKQKRIQENIPGWLQDTFKQFAGTKGSMVHTNLMSGELKYMRFVIRK